MAILDKFRTPTLWPGAGDDGNFAKAFLSGKEDDELKPSRSQQHSALPARPSDSRRPKPKRRFKTNCIFSSTSCI